MSGSRHAQPSGKILIVEDEFLVALQLEDILADAGYRVVGTLPDSQGLSAIPEAPDIAFVDLNLRDGLTGPTVAWRLAEQFASRVIYVTANPGQIGEPAPTAVGVVQKPFSRAAILGAISYVLQGCPEHARPADLEPLTPPSRQG